MPHMTGHSQAELLLGSNLRTRLHAVKPDLGKTVETKQFHQKKIHNQKSREKVFAVRDKAFFITNNHYNYILFIYIINLL